MGTFLIVALASITFGLIILDTSSGGKNDKLAEAALVSFTLLCVCAYVMYKG